MQKVVQLQSTHFLFIVLTFKIKVWVGHQSAMIVDNTCTVSMYDLSPSVMETPGAGKTATSSSKSSRAS